MIKKIHVRHLKPGMFIHSLNCNWIEHNFLSNSFMIHGEDDIRKIHFIGTEEVLIDSVKGIDFDDSVNQTKNRTQAEISSHVKRRMSELTGHIKPIVPSTFQEELKIAKVVQKEAVNVVQNLMHAARLGKQIELETVEPVVRDMTDSILRNQDALISLCRIREKDNYTFQHSVSVGALLISFARTIELSSTDMFQLGIGGMLHDIGKTMIPDRILNKPGKLTDDENVIMQMHTTHGWNILANMRGLATPSIDVVTQHHERFDGNGYPSRLKGHEMSIYGQMASIVDVYDALTSERCYRKAMTPTIALSKMFEWSKFHFNPGLVNAFVRTIGIYPVGTLVMLASGKMGVVIEQHADDLTKPIVRIVFRAREERDLSKEIVDLSKPLLHGLCDKIISHESAAAWNIDPVECM